MCPPPPPHWICCPFFWPLCLFLDGLGAFCLAKQSALRSLKCPFWKWPCPSKSLIRALAWTNREFSQCNECNRAALIELHGCASLACVRTCTLNALAITATGKNCFCTSVARSISRVTRPFEISDYLPGHVSDYDERSQRATPYVLYTKGIVWAVINRPNPGFGRVVEIF